MILKGDIKHLLLQLFNSSGLFFKILNKYDRMLLNHASPVLHAIQYLLGNQNVDNLKRFRKLNGAKLIV